MKNQQVIVVGAGLGGLTTALRLVKKGYKVTILEKKHTSRWKIKSHPKRWFHVRHRSKFF